MTWTADEDLRRVYGPYEMVPERDGLLTAHLVSLPGRQIRVLPDGASSGQKRSRVIKVALEVMAALRGDSGSLPGFDPMLYLVGSLAYSGLEWEQITDDPAVEDFLDEWLSVMKDWYTDESRFTAKLLVADLASSGWQIVKRDDT